MAAAETLGAAAAGRAAGRSHSLALCLGLAYAALASLWILASAALAGRWTEDPALLLQAVQASGLLLVAATAVLVCVGARHAARHLGSYQIVLHQRELQLSGIVDTVMDAIITVDAAQKIVVFNRAACQVFRLSAEQALGQSLDRFVPAKLQAAHREQVRQFAHHGKTVRHMGRLHTLVGLRADGEEFPMQASLSRLGEGERALMTVVLRDMTEQLAGERAHQEKLAAEAASLAKNRFLARMSHELRTPLHAILGFSELLLTHPGDALTPAQARHVEHIRQGGRHLLALVTDVLDVSRVESGDLKLECTGVDVQRLLDEACLLIEEQARLHGVALDAAYRGAAAATAWCDPLRTRQVLLNVLSNAVKYNLPGGHVRVELAVDEGHVQVQVADTGIGMTQEQLAHLYEPFNRLGRERGGVEGTGIGLALTRQLVWLMKGDLQIDSAPGNGTRLLLTLPRSGPAAPAPAGGPQAASPLPPTAPPPAVAGAGTALPTVLYIEDNPVNVLMVDELLKRWPIATLVQAADGAAGLAQARSLQPDLVLLDMRLPDMSGLEVLARLRSDPVTAALRVVVLSASAAQGEMDQALGCGAIAYWTKPFQFDRMLRDLQGLLERRCEAA